MLIIIQNTCRLKATTIAVATLLSVTLFAQSNANKKNHIYNVYISDCECDKITSTNKDNGTINNGRSQLGFKIKEYPGIFTSLHGVLDCQRFCMQLPNGTKISLYPDRVS